MNENTNIYQKILKDRILSIAFKDIVGRNTSNNAPYHHFHHMICVTKWAMILAEDEGIAEGTTIWYELMLACMFHDINHSMGELPDKVNVSEAVAQFLGFYDSHLKFRSDYPISDTAVTYIIRATEYPYVIDDSELSKCQAIIRDADLLVSLEPDWFQNAFLGLMKEMKVEDISKMIAGQGAFHRGIKMRTTAGILLYDTMWPNQCLATIDLLEELYK